MKMNPGNSLKKKWYGNRFKFARQVARIFGGVIDQRDQFFEKLVRSFLACLPPIESERGLDVPVNQSVWPIVHEPKSPRRITSIWARNSSELIE